MALSPTTPGKRYPPPVTQALLTQCKNLVPSELVYSSDDDEDSASEAAAASNRLQLIIGTRTACNTKGKTTKAQIEQLNDLKNPQPSTSLALVREMKKHNLAREKAEKSRKRSLVVPVLVTPLRSRKRMCSATEIETPTSLNNIPESSTSPVSTASSSTPPENHGLPETPKFKKNNRKRNGKPTKNEVTLPNERQVESPMTNGRILKSKRNSAAKPETKSESTSPDTCKEDIPLFRRSKRERRPPLQDHEYWVYTT